MKACHSRYKGFSFIEIMFAMLCLGILLVPIFKMLKQGTTGTARNRNEILAQQHASNLMSYAFFLPYNHEFLKVSATRDIGALEVDFAGNKIDLSMNESQFRRTIAISEVKTEKWPHTYKIVRVAVSWQEPNGPNRSLKLAGLVAK